MVLLSRFLIFTSLLLLAGCDYGDEQVLTLRVQPQDFQVQISADGILEASVATQVTIPGGLRGPQSLVWLVDNFTWVKAGDTVARLDPDREQYNLQLEQFAFDRLTLDKQIQQRKDNSTGDALELDFGVTTAELALAKRFFVEDERVYTKLDIIDQRRNQDYLIAKQDYLHWGETQHQQQALAEQSLLALKQRSYQDNIVRYRENLTQVEIKAPHDGLFVYHRDWDGQEPAVGDMVWAGMALGILPDTTKMQARLYVLESEAAGLKSGLKTRVRLDAYPDKIFTGTVTQVSALASPRDKQSPVNYFECVVSLDNTVPGLMKPGRQINAVIDVLARNNVLTVPNQALFHNEQQDYWLYLRTDTGFVRHSVTLGARSLDLSVIHRGLKPGR